MSKEVEKRFITGGLEIRKNDDGTESRTIEGYGVVFDSYSHDLGWFRERVNRSAFENVDMTDVVATFNHDFNQIMARTTNTLSLTIDDKGVKYSFEAPKTTAGNDLLENVKNGNIRGSSFMFTVGEDRWTFKKSTDEVDEREILKVDKLYELGPVTMPAYPETTTSAKRSYDEAFNSVKAKDNAEKEIKERQTKNRISIIKAKNK